jgi:MSHA biogenesis protein MshK
MKTATLVILAGLACSGAHAAPFADPTQPPGVVPGGADSATAAVEGPRLQSVLIAPNRRVAVIGGQTVSLGGKYGEARVVRITEGEVVLQTGQERQTLKLFSDVEKRVTRPPVRTRAHKGARK